MLRLFQILKHEVIKIIPAVLFFLIAFNLIAFTDNLMLRHTHAQYLSYTLATIGALLVGKFLLIVNTLPFINAFPNKPLIYNILWKFLIYGSLALVFRIVEKSIDFALHFKQSELVYQHLQVMIVSPIFWAVNIWLLILFLIYIFASEFIRAFGKKEIEFMLFYNNKPKIK